MTTGHGGKRPGAGRKPGKVGKAKKELQNMAKDHAQEALETLRKIMTNDQEPAAARVSAANAILDRGYGKPQQAIVGDPDAPVAVQMITRRVVDPKDGA
jgi:hypothetical protein